MCDKTLGKPEEKEKPDKESEAVDTFQMNMETIPFCDYWFQSAAGTEIERPYIRCIKEIYEKQVDLLRKRK